MPSFDLVNFVAGLVIGLLCLYLFMRRIVRTVDANCTVLIDVERELAAARRDRNASQAMKGGVTCSPQPRF